MWFLQKSVINIHECDFCFTVYRVAGLTQPVLGGLLVKGAIAPGTRLLVGPLPDGEFSPVRVVSLHRNKAPCCLVRASQSASLTLAPPTNRSPPLPHLRPGMVLVSPRDRPHATLFFQVCRSFDICINKLQTVQIMLLL